MTNSKQRLPHFTKEKLEELARLNYKYVKEFAEQYKEDDIEYYNSAILPVLEKYKHLDIIEKSIVKEPDIINNISTVKEESEPDIIFCSNCGSKNYMGSQYCFKCGENINIPENAFKTNASSYEKKDEHEFLSYESWMRGDNRNVANGIIQNGKSSSNSSSKLILALLLIFILVIVSIIMIKERVENQRRLQEELIILEGAKNLFGK